MFCQKCGKENSDDATFCNACGANLTKKSTPITVNIQVASYIPLKENEIRLLQEKLNNEVSNIGPIILGLMGGIIGGVLVVMVGTVIGTAGGLFFFGIAYSWYNSKVEAAKNTEIELSAAKAELAKMKNA